MTGADKYVSKHKAIGRMRQKRPLRSTILFWAWHVLFNSHTNCVCVEQKRTYQIGNDIIEYVTAIY